MKKFLITAILMISMATTVFAGVDSKVVEHLENISVTIATGHGQGSGVIVTRTRDKDTINFCWTAAHVVEGLRKTKTVVDKNGNTKTVVEFDDAKVIKTLVEDGRNVGKLEIFANVVRYNQEEDLALLRIRQKNFLKDGVKFYLDEKIPTIGTSLCHVGSLLGELGSNSFTTGVMSQHGRLVEGKVFDQTTVIAMPGSSGGGVYLDDGRLVGNILRGSGEAFNLICPVRRVVSWAKASKIEWAVNDAVALPSEEELKKLPIEDTGVVFNDAYRTAAGVHSTPKAKKLIYTDKMKFSEKLDEIFSSVR